MYIGQIDFDFNLFDYKEIIIEYTEGATRYKYDVVPYQTIITLSANYFTEGKGVGTRQIYMAYAGNGNAMYSTTPSYYSVGGEAPYSVCVPSKIYGIK